MHADRKSVVAFFDCFSGISGDMCLGALVDAGARLNDIARWLKKLRLGGYTLHQKSVVRSGLSATKVDVVLKGKGSEARKWADVNRIIGASSLPEHIKKKGKEIFRTLFDAEGSVHGMQFDKVHLHELGAVDCLVDVFGTLIGLDLLGIEKICSSPLNLGSGFVKTSHGLLPVPAPATAAILEGIPVYQTGEGFELTTPTGAVIVKTLSREFGEMPAFIPEKIGIGAGGREIEGRPNVLRVFIGKEYRATEAESVTVIETNIDDMNPQVYDYLSERVLNAGALDVFLTNIIMKKMRPGVKMTVLCHREKRNEMIDLILRETTSIGVRYSEMPRVCMEREIREVTTRYGKVRVKTAGLGNFSKTTPEYEDCKKIADKTGTPLIEIIEEAKRAAGKKSKS